MKKTTKVFWSMCAALVVMGGVFMTAGAVMGASRSIEIGRDWGTGFTNYHIDEQALPAFQKIDIGVIAADIEVVPSNHYGLKLDLDGRSNETKLVWSVTNGVLEVKEEHEEGYFGWFDPAAWVSFFSEWRQSRTFIPKGEIFVYLPAGAQMERISLATVDGELIASGLQANGFVSSSVSGDVELTNCKFSSTELNLVDGDVEVKDSHLGRTTIDTVSNDIKLERVTTDSFSYNAVDADLYFSGKPLGETEITGISGDIEFEIDGNRGDYRIETEEGKKRVKVYDGSGGEVQEAPGQPNRISISTMGGECKIRFR